MITVNIQDVESIKVNKYLDKNKENKSFITLDIDCNGSNTSIFIFNRQQLNLLQQAIEEAAQLW